MANSCLGHNKDENVLAFDAYNQSSTGAVSKTVAARDDQDTASLVASWPADIAPTLNAAFGEKQGLEDQHALGGAGLFVPAVVGALTAKGPCGLGAPEVDAHHYVLSSGQANASITRGKTGALDCLHEAPIVAHALRGEDGTGRGTPLVPVGITLHGTDGTQSVASFTELSSSLRARTPSGVENSTTTAVLQAVPVAFAQNSRDEVRLQGGDGQIVGALAAEPGMKQTTYVAFQPRIARNGRGDMGDLVNALQAQSGGTGKGDAAPCVAVAPALTASNDPSRSPQSSEVTQQVEAVHLASMQVRRLTPRECERLQGFPDDYTAIPWRGRAAIDCPDGPRYKALGNSMAVPCMRWIGTRIKE